MDTLTEYPLTTGIETLAVVCGISRPTDRALSDLDTRTSPAVVSYRPRRVPAGVSYAAIHRNPKGWGAAAEVNLTTLLHGPGSEVGSLSAGEVPLAVERLLPTLRAVLPGVKFPEELWGFDVTRYDPSFTVLLPSDWDIGMVIAAAHASWCARRRGREVVSLHDSGGRTVTHRISNGHSRSLYDKTFQARLQGKECPDGALRAEARIRPRDPIALSDTEKLVSQSSEEITALAASIGPMIASSAMVTVRTLIEAQKELGEEPNPSEAYTLATVHAIIQDTGSVDRLVADGMSRATAYRRRARLWKLLAAADDSVQDRAAADVFGSTEVLLARQLLDRIRE